MENVYDEKARFVVEELAPLVVSVTEGDVRELVYMTDGREEAVIIVFRNSYRKTVNVTGDSLKAVAQDVLKALD